MNRRMIELFLLLIIVSVLPVKAQVQDILTFEVQSFREESDSLIVDYRVWVPKQLVGSGQGLRISPMVQTADSLLLLPPITLLGKNKQKVLHRYHQNSGLAPLPVSLPPSNSLTPYHYTVRVPYRLWMDSAKVSIRQEVSGYRGKKVTTRYLLGDRVEPEAKEPYQPKIEVALIVPAKEEKRRTRQGKAFLDFQVGRSIIIPSLRRNPEELAKIDDAVRDVKNNRDVQITGLYIEGYASPEGKYEINERLARERATALKTYIRQKFGFDDALFKVSWTPEDWDGLVAAVQAGNMDYKDRVLETIASTDILDGRERKLMDIAAGIPYRKMLREIFPELRRVEYQIDYTVKDYTVEESKLLATQKPAQLSLRELYMLAKSYGSDTPEYTNILIETIPRYYPDDATANNNAAAVMITTGELNTAGRLLDKAGDSPEALNNRGVICLLAGELDKAEELFLKAKDSGVVQAAHNLMETQAKRQDNKRMQRRNR